MSVLRSVVRRVAVVVWGSVAVMGCAGVDEDEGTGVAQIAITAVPTDGSVGCIAVTATGATTVTRRTDVQPGEGSVLHMQGLPTGTVSFTGNAYAGACALVSPSSVPTWISDPVIATVSAVPVTVSLALKRNGQATVGVDFDDTASCRAIGAPCQSSAECCSGICGDHACQSSCQGEGLASCNGACVDVQSDPQNCGGCGQMCPQGAVCTGGGCSMMQPACNDGVKNGTEADVDCGGGSCTLCASGKTCSVDADCASGMCANGLCP